MKSALHGLKPSSAARAKDGEFPEAQSMDVCASGRGGWICLPHFFEEYEKNFISQNIA